MSDFPVPALGVYETPDLHLASFLRCRGFTIADLQRQDNRTIFLFRDSLEIGNWRGSAVGNGS